MRDVPDQEKHKVLDYERTQQLPLTDVVETNSDQYHDGSNDRIHDQYQLDMDEPEVHDAFDTEIPLENNKDNLSWQDGSMEAEEREEPIIENNDIE
ncbi:hypothetical protein Tco_0715653 [Tanacetum coccineum]